MDDYLFTGCGIGVLLRMFWVLAVVLVRTVRGGSSTENEDMEHVLIFEADPEHLLVAPPEYTDEKVALQAPERKSTEVQA